MISNFVNFMCPEVEFPLAGRRGVTRMLYSLFLHLGRAFFDVCRYLGFDPFAVIVGFS